MDRPLCPMYTLPHSQGNYPKENILHSEHGESLKSRKLYVIVYYYNPLHVSINPLLIIRRSNCKNTIPHAELIQFDLLMMSTELLETCRGL